MARSDNTSYGYPRPSQGILGRSGARLRLAPKHKAYLEDVAGWLALAGLIGVLHLSAYLLAP